MYGRLWDYSYPISAMLDNQQASGDGKGDGKEEGGEDGKWTPASRMHLYGRHVRHARTEDLQPSKWSAGYRQVQG